MTRAPAAPRRYVVVAVLAVLAVLGGAVGPLGLRRAFVNTSAKDRIEAAPPPALFPDATVAPMAPLIAAQAPRRRSG